MNPGIWYKCTLEVTRVEITKDNSILEIVTRRIKLMKEVEMPVSTPEDRLLVQEKITEKDIVNEMGANLTKFSETM